MSTQESALPDEQNFKKARKKAFVVSPIGAPGTDAYKNAHYALKYIYKVALDESDWEVHRADEGESPDSINQHVIKSLYEADLVIADLTGHNPNVFYELAIAHGIRKPVVHLISKGEKMPFDIADQRAIFYDLKDLASVEETIDMLKRYAIHAIENVEDLVTPLSNFERFNQLKNSVSENDGGMAVVELFEKISSRLAKLEYTIAKRQVVSTLPLGGTEVLQKLKNDIDIYSRQIKDLESQENLNAKDEKLLKALKNTRDMLLQDLQITDNESISLRLGPASAG